MPMLKDLEKARVTMIREERRGRLAGIVQILCQRRLAALAEASIAAAESVARQDAEREGQWK